MKHAKRLLVIGTLALLLFSAAPVVHAQSTGINNPNVSTPTTMYFHVDGIQDFPINTQPPDDKYQKGERPPLTTQSLSCLPETPAGSIISSSYHTYYGYSSPGYVEYDFEENGGPRYHKERGLSFDVNLDTSAGATAYWYLETQVTSNDGSGFPQDPNNAPVVIPNVVTKVTVREGDDVGVGDEAFNTGAVIAVGQTEPQTLYPGMPANDYVTHSTVNGVNVYEFKVPLQIQKATIDKDESYNVRIDTFIQDPTGALCSGPGYPEDKYLMPNLVRVHTSPGHRPRMDWNVMNPIRLEFLHPMFLGDELVIHTAMNSPWGNYDVDEMEGGIEISVDGPSPATSLERVALVQRFHEHDHHQEAVDITWTWPYKEDGAKDGEYTVKLSVWNDQHTAQATGVATFEIGKDYKVTGCGNIDRATQDCITEVQKDQVEPEGKDSPGIGVVAILGLLGAGMYLQRRRR